MSLSFLTGTLVLYKSNIQKTWADLGISIIVVIQKIAAKNLHTYENFRLVFREMSLSFQTGTLILYKSNIQKTWADLHISNIVVIQRIQGKMGYRIFL